MGKAIVIKDVNFETNKLATVTLSDSKGCTGITLDKSTYSMNAINSTVTLVPTVTPADTTDDIEWTTSDQNVVTVANGVVTQVGVGSATITAICGSYSSTCAITAKNVLSYDYKIGESASKASGSTKDYAEVTSSGLSSKYAAIVNTTVQTDKKVRKAGDSSIVASNIYPFILGTGATTITATVPDTIRITAWFVNSVTACDYSVDHATYAVFAKFISGDASIYDSNVLLGNRTITIPEGADSVVFTLHKPSDAITDNDLTGVSIEVS